MQAITENLIAKAGGTAGVAGYRRSRVVLSALLTAVDFWSNLYTGYTHLDEDKYSYAVATFAIITIGVIMSTCLGGVYGFNDYDKIAESKPIPNCNRALGAVAGFFGLQPLLAAVHISAATDAAVMSDAQYAESALMTFKLIETFVEAIPQMLLQSYILFKSYLDQTIHTDYNDFDVGMLWFSFSMSLLSGSYVIYEIRLMGMPSKRVMNYGGFRMFQIYKVYSSKTRILVMVQTMLEVLARVGTTALFFVAFRYTGILALAFAIMFTAVIFGVIHSEGPATVPHRTRLVGVVVYLVIRVVHLVALYTPVPEPPVVIPIGQAGVIRVRPHSTTEMYVIQILAVLEVIAMTTLPIISTELRGGNDLTRDVFVGLCASGVSICMIGSASVVRIVFTTVFA